VYKRTKKRSGNVHARSDSASDFGVAFNFAIALMDAGGLKLTGPVFAAEHDLMGAYYTNYQNQGTPQLNSIGNSTMGDTVKNLPQFTEKFDGSSLRIAIVHARWNKSVIDALIAGAVAKLKEAGVKEHNIVLQSVPGSFELPLACQRCVYVVPTPLQYPQT
jgi:hypothetical protein